MVLLMVRDAYANYVVQTTLDVVPECDEKRLLLEELNAHAAELVGLSRSFGSFEFVSNLPLLLFNGQRNYTFAKHIMTKLNS